MVFIVVKLCAKAAIVADTRTGEGERRITFQKRAFWQFDQVQAVHLKIP